jgi:hypothetical protein
MVRFYLVVISFVLHRVHGPVENGVLTIHLMVDVGRRVVFEGRRLL